MKIFVLGCSFTKYHWPTWVDILQDNNNIEILNFARPAIGNQRIFYKLCELYLKNYITSEDKVVIVWTSWHREDRLKNNSWIESGNIFNSKYYSKSFIKKYWDADFDIVRNCNDIILANILYPDIVNGSWLNFNSMEKYKGDGITQRTSYENLENKYLFYYNNMPNFLKFNHSKNTYFYNKCDDKHPDILCHYDYAYRMANVLKLNIPIFDKWKKYQDKISDAINLDLKKEKLYEKIKESINYKQLFNDPIHLEN